MPRHEAGIVRESAMAPAIRSILLSALLAFGVASIASAAPVAPASVDGGMAYKQHCASCPGANLEGSVGPALKGSSFDTRWRAKPDELDKVITATMPIGEGNSLPADAYHAITQYVLAGASAPAAAAPSAPPPAKLPDDPKVFGVASNPAMGPDDAELLKPNEGDWLRYNRDYQGQRFAPFSEITPQNAGTLVPKCIFQTGEVGTFQASPVVHGGRLYVTTANHTFAIDAASCRRSGRTNMSPPARPRFRPIGASHSTRAVARWTAM
jgi:alcohol dehydrogenase (cytochrome c)